MLNDFFDLPKTNRLLTFLNNIATPSESIEPRTNIEKALYNISKNTKNNTSVIVLETHEDDTISPVSGDDLDRLRNRRISGVIFEGLYLPLIFYSYSTSNPFRYTIFGGFDERDDGVIRGIGVVIDIHDGSCVMYDNPLTYTVTALNRVYDDRNIDSIPNLMTYIESAITELYSASESVSANVALHIYSDFLTDIGQFYVPIFINNSTILDQVTIRYCIKLCISATGFNMTLAMTDGTSPRVYDIFYSSSISAVGTNKYGKTN